MLKKIIVTVAVLSLSISFIGCENMYSYDDETIQTEETQTADPGTKEYEEWDPWW